MNLEQFQETIWEEGRRLFRDMPWRTDTQPYYVLLSEIMLQQTQVERVKVKFAEFIASFPTIQTLAEAPLSEVLTHWSGLGYNRRAKFLHEAAKKVVADFEGTVPSTLAELESLPGVGPNTAGAIMAYSFNHPVVYIETNIRTVYFHHFFEDQPLVSDKELRELVARTVDQEHPREWYWAMMDYGSYLKRQGVGRNNKSAHYKKQSPLKGSLREVRGLILKALATGARDEHALRQEMPQDDRYDQALSALIQEGMVARTDERVHLA